MALCILWLLSKPPTSWIEQIYSRGLYPFVSGMIIPITAAIPFSLSTLLLLAIPLLWTVISLSSFQKRQSNWWWGWWLWRSLVTASIIYALFVLLWGANYRRESVETLYGLPDLSISQDEVKTLADSLLKTIETTVNAERNETRAITAIQDAMIQINYNLTGASLTLPVPKRLPAGWLILSGRASGVVSPWTLEAHVDGALPEVAYIAVGAHELAHLAGFAGEADADFVSAIAGLNAKDDYARYAVALKIWWDAVSTFSTELQKQYLDKLPSQARADLESSFEPYRRYRMPIWIQRLQHQSYDWYLKTQGVEAGISDYSRIISLLVKAQKQNRFIHL